MKKLSGGMILLIVIGFLFATNPDESKFTGWITSRLCDQLAQGPPAKNDWEQMGRSIGMAALPGLVRTVTRREDWGLFSLYRGRGDWQGALVLGIGGKFVGLANGKRA